MGTVGSSDRRKPPATSSGTTTALGLSQGHLTHPGATQPFDDTGPRLPPALRAQGGGGTGPGAVLDSPSAHTVFCSQGSPVALWLSGKGQGPAEGFWGAPAVTLRNRVESRGPGWKHAARRWLLWGQGPACRHHAPMNSSATDLHTHLLQDSCLRDSDVAQAHGRHLRKTNTACCWLALGGAVRRIPSGPAHPPGQRAAGGGSAPGLHVPWKGHKGPANTSQGRTHCVQLQAHPDRTLGSLQSPIGLRPPCMWPDAWRG